MASIRASSAWVFAWPDVGTQVVAVHVVHPRQALPTAHRAGDVRRLAVVLGRPGEVGTGVADLEQTRAARVHVGEDGSPLQRVVHDGSTSGHGGQCTHRRDLPPLPARNGRGRRDASGRPGARCIVAIHRRTATEGGGVLEFAILGLLHQSPMHGYELRKRSSQVLGGLRSISYGSLYPALKRMHAAGLIATDEPDPQPAAGRRSAAHRTARQGRLQDHRRGQGAPPRAARRDRPGGLRRRRELRRPARVLPAHRVRRAAADPRGSPADRRAAARGPALLAVPHPRAARPLHPRAAAPRAGVGRPRGPLADRAHRHRAPRGRRGRSRRAHTRNPPRHQ